MQLAFSRLKRPWQSATLISAHGRPLDELEQAVKAGATPIAILTDAINTPAAIARCIASLDLPITYRLWICEHLGNPDERVQQMSLLEAQQYSAAALNVVVLERDTTFPEMTDLPILGMPDAAFASFRDRPGLITKREVRVQVLAELALQPGQVIWDIGAGTGSVSIEIARLVPDARVWAVEKTMVGSHLIRQNCERFGLQNITVVTGQAPEALAPLPRPHRIFIGGSSGSVSAILHHGAEQLTPHGKIVAAFATLENLSAIVQWLQQHPHWQGDYHQIALSRSVAIGSLTRWHPLNPVTLASLKRRSA